MADDPFPVFGSSFTKQNTFLAESINVVTDAVRCHGVKTFGGYFRELLSSDIALFSNAIRC